MDGGHLIAKVIARQGVDFIFTLCGGHISPILSGCKKEGVRVIDVRHEVNAVFAADAVARLTGRPGVAAVTAGPGLTNTITAIKNAAMAQSPLVLLGGAAPTVLKGRGALQDIDQLSLMQPLVKWQASISRVSQILPTLEEAFRQAQKGVPGPVFVECPIDTLYDESLVRSWYGEAGGKNPKTLSQKAIKWYLNWHLDRVFNRKDRYTDASLVRVSPPSHSQADLARVKRAIEKSSKPVFLIGSQAILQADRVSEIAAALKKLGVPCYLSGMARGLLGAEHELLNRHKRRVTLKEADLVLLAGVPCDFRLEYGNHISRRATYISVNRSKTDLNKNRRPDIGVLADAGGFLIELADQISREGELGEWKASLAERAGQREDQIDESAAEQLQGINPVRLFRELNPRLDKKSILIADGGDFVGTGSYTLHARGPLTWLDPGAFGTLGVGGGFALGAKLCRPDHEVWIVWGDGSSAYSLAEFDTFARHQAPVIGLIGNDACWAQIARDQVEILKDDVAVMLEHNEYQTVAAGYGGVGSRVSDMDAFLRSVDEAKAASRDGKPYLINAIIGRSDFRKGSISV